MPEKRWNWSIISWESENDAGKAVELHHHLVRRQRMMQEKQWKWSMISWQTENDAGKAVELGLHFERGQGMMQKSSRVGTSFRERRK
ncbi:hypothetical protein [Bacillus salacetis]|nr:hypothetical protein [Bacillus salacetis]